MKYWHMHNISFPEYICETLSVVLDHDMYFQSYSIFITSTLNYDFVYLLLIF